VKTVAQEQAIFHKDADIPGTSELPDAPTAQERRHMVDFVNNPACPLYRFIGNDHARRKLAEAAFVALAKGNHCCRETAVFFSGPASVGKTTLAKLFAELLELPFVELQPRAITKVDDLFNTIQHQIGEFGLPIVAVRGSKHYRLPPCIIFADEVHGFTQKIVDALLKACESKDAVFATEKGEVVDCRYVCWIIATTEAGDLFDAFESRFDEVALRYYTREELARIVKLNNPDLEMDVCRLVSKFQRLPRKLLRFATSMRNKKEMHPHLAWESVALEVAKDSGIDEHGMSAKHLEILKSLKKKPVAKDRLPVMIGVKKPELEKKLMPELICATEDQPAMVEVGSDGYRITEAGLNELTKRGL
jgi:Holliday junction resolvasome RuvABC ATP-dependent DNA helicase subunit